jgi:hypothetical protein
MIEFTSPECLANRGAADALSVFEDAGYLMNIKL